MDLNLLIVNDEVLTLQTIADGIDWQEVGIARVFRAHNSATARGIMERESIQVILCDIEMPDEDGLSFMQWVRDNKYEAECIFLTCHAKFAYAQKAISLKCRNYVLMPAKLEDIAAEVGDTVKLIRQRTDVRTLENYGARWLESQKDELEEEQKEREGSKKDSLTLVKECKQLIYENLANPELSVNYVAEKMFLNAIYLNRVFKKHEGVSISQSIIKERMTLAGKLMANPGVTANDVAIKVGYQNYPYFSTAFKKVYGCSPQQYKEDNCK